MLRSYYETLDRYRLLTYGQQVVRAVRELERPELAGVIHGELRHLIVDEYQDVNPAQERLIELLTGPAVELCVVGDDDQAIYQWRGSDISNIVTFAARYPSVSMFEITTNRRSRPQVIETANRFATTIPGRLDKTMQSHRNPSASGGPEVVVWSASSEVEEAGWIASLIMDINETGVPYKDIAVLVRSRAAYKRLVEQFATFDIPVQPGGRSGLFDQPEAVVLGHTIAWLTDTEWRDRYGPSRVITDVSLFDEYQRVFTLSAPLICRISPRSRRRQRCYVALCFCSARFARWRPSPRPRTHNPPVARLSRHQQQKLRRPHPQLRPGTPVWSGFGQAKMTPAADPKTHEPYTIAKDGFRATYYEMVGQYGTHVDPPAHFAGRDHHGQIPLKQMILPLVVLDDTPYLAKDPNHAFSIADLRAWEKQARARAERCLRGASHRHV